MGIQPTERANFYDSNNILIRAGPFDIVNGSSWIKETVIISGRQFSTRKDKWFKPLLEANKDILHQQSAALYANGFYSSAMIQQEYASFSIQKAYKLFLYDPVFKPTKMKVKRLAVIYLYKNIFTEANRYQVLTLNYYVHYEKLYV